MNDLNQLIEVHLAGAHEDAHGRSAHLLFVSGPLRQTVIALTAGSSLDEHNSPAAGSLQVLRGHVNLTVAGGDQDLASGHIHPLPPERHGLTALEDSVVLLTAVTRTE